MRYLEGRTLKRSVLKNPSSAQGDKVEIQAWVNKTGLRLGDKLGIDKIM